MPYVQRTGGAISGVFANFQPGFAEEWLDDDHPEVVAYLSPPDPIIVLYPVHLWSRMTNEEVVQVEAAMASQPIRVQNIFKYASSYRSDHELWPLLETMATGLFGAERAAEILAAS